jgi:hypothetical protein
MPEVQAYKGPCRQLSPRAAQPNVFFGLMVLPMLETV